MNSKFIFNDEKIKKDIALVCKNYRKQENITQEELGKKLYVSAQAISKWERALSIPDIVQLSHLSYISGLPIDNIINNNSSVETLKVKVNLDKSFYLIYPDVKLYLDNELKSILRFGSSIELNLTNESKLSLVVGNYVSNIDSDYTVNKNINLKLALITGKIKVLGNNKHCTNVTYYKYNEMNFSFMNLILIIILAFLVARIAYIFLYL